MALKINEITGCQLHEGIIRRWLPAAGLVWRRVVPRLRNRDSHKDEKMAAIHQALDECSVEHPVFYEDEVDTHLNSKIGALHSGTGKDYHADRRQLHNPQKS